MQLSESATWTGKLGGKKTRNMLIGAFLVIVILSGAVGYFFNSNVEAYDALHRSRATQASLNAHEVFAELHTFIYAFDENMHDLYEVMESDRFDNETGKYVVHLIREHLDKIAELSWSDIKHALHRLNIADPELQFLNLTSYSFVKQAIHETLQQVHHLGMGGRSLDAQELIVLLQELYDVLDIDLAINYQRVKLYGLEWCFLELNQYWSLEGRYGGDIPSGEEYSSREQIFDWIVGNATALHNDLIQWEEYHVPTAW